jgi:predicted 3-demethylubiquinone-9 3-methyltransferase (glyoxalase superfamily)
MDRIAPFLWFNTEAEEAAKFFTSIFKNSKIKHVSRYPEGTPGPVGSVMVVIFELDGREFFALNGGPTFKFTEAISLAVQCENQEEIDYYWEKLTSGGGKPVECGWLKDKYGLSWQVMPKKLGELMSTPEKAKRVMAEVMKSVKLDLKKMEAAAAGK